LIRSGLFLLMSCSSTKKKLRCVVCDNKRQMVHLLALTKMLWYVHKIPLHFLQ
jgi:hypothetical protein